MRSHTRIPKFTVTRPIPFVFPLLFLVLNAKLAIYLPCFRLYFHLFPVFPVFRGRPPSSSPRVPGHRIVGTVLPRIPQPRGDAVDGQDNGLAERFGRGAVLAR